MGFLKIDSWRIEKELITTNTTSRILQKSYQVNQIFHGLLEEGIYKFKTIHTVLLLSKMMQFHHFFKPVVVKSKILN